MENQDNKRMTKIVWLKKILESDYNELKKDLDKLIEEYKVLKELDDLKKKQTRIEAQIKRRNEKVNKFRSGN